ncbi:MAG: UDP-N-acetylmuramoyl-tripeptide--D-alanyl-D-alanine ligase [Propionibacteriaceae bacterium]|jgi:UDP-N-acetylmuramoyl-tripeptide--D-alanyl-D-alanine ligase|nr:UDP-N-acetylmuramoyl-tripeptide--D-alanyl-D-alanine ligase [Propionibacteriaceae bacterium]
MDERSAGELARLCRADLVGDPGSRVGPDVVIDSRAVTPGALFVALAGENTDGHHFVGQAAAAGAGAALVRHSVAVDIPCLVVDDTLAGLGRLAAGVVAEARTGQLRCIGITGSSGKTSTKDLLSQICESVGPTVSPVGSFNNEIGVPLTAARVDSSTQFLISEFGSRGIGQLSQLSKIVPIDTAVVLNVGTAHLGEFGSVENVARAKGELAEAASEWVVLNDDDALVRRMDRLTTAKVAAFSVGAAPKLGELRVWATGLRADALQRHSFTAHVSGVDESTAEINLQVSGEHQVANALAALGAALTQGVEFAVAAAALNQAVARSKWRMELVTGANGLLIVNDAYNANPDSMRAALSALAGMRRSGGRIIALLGDMLELGETAAQAHQEIGRFAAQHGVDLLVALGDQRDALVRGASAGGIAAIAAPGRDEAIAEVLSFATPDDVVLVKASRGLALESVAERLGASES